MPKAFLIDLTKCMGCRACQVACKRWNNLEAEHTSMTSDSWTNPLRLSARTWTRVDFTELQSPQYKAGMKWVFARRQCMHCLHPACVSACPVGALRKTDEGPVVYDTQKCIGCRYCMVSCPFGVPGFEWDKGLLAQPLIKKCKMCVDRLGAGMEPACVKHCPPRATIFGERDELLATAKERIAANPDTYINHIYGENEVGGTSMLYLSSVPFEQIGFPKLGSEAVTVNTEAVMEKTLPFAAAWTVILAATYGVVKFRERTDPQGEEKNQ